MWQIYSVESQPGLLVTSVQKGLTSFGKRETCIGFRTELHFMHKVQFRPEYELRETMLLDVA